MAAGQDKGTTKSSWTGIITLIGRSRVAHLLAGGLGKRPAQVNPAEFVPSVFDIAVMQESAAHSIRRFALEHLPFFSNCQPPSFKRFQTHQFIDEMSTKSSCIPLPIEHLNENKNADFVKHWQRLLHYLVRDKYGRPLEDAIYHGDQLTEEMGHQAKHTRCSETKPEDRFDGLHPTSCYFHQQMNKYGQMIYRFGNKVTRTVKGSMWSLLTVLGRGDIKEDPTKAANSWEDVTDTLARALTCSKLLHEMGIDVPSVPSPPAREDPPNATPSARRKLEKAGAQTALESWKAAVTKLLEAKIPSDILTAAARQRARQIKDWKWQKLVEVSNKVSKELADLHDISDSLSAVVSCTPLAESSHQDGTVWRCSSPDCDATFNRRVKAWRHFNSEHVAPTVPVPRPSPEYMPSADGKGDQLQSYLTALLRDTLYDHVIREFVRAGDGTRLWHAKRLLLVELRASIDRHKKEKARPGQDNASAAELKARRRTGPIKYALATFRAVMDSLTMPPDLSLRLLHDGFYNARGGVGNNTALDFFVEHCVKAFKQWVRGFQRDNRTPYERISLSLLCIDALVTKFKEGGGAGSVGSSKRTAPDKDVAAVINYLKPITPWTYEDGRVMAQFQHFDPDPVGDVNPVSYRDWLMSKIWTTDADAVRTSHAFSAFQEAVNNGEHDRSSSRDNGAGGAGGDGGDGGDDGDDGDDGGDGGVALRGSAVAEKNDGIPPITDLHVNIVSQIVYSLPGIGERYDKARKVPMGLRRQSK